ncbi:hypothetical protein ACCT30_44905, partial [Rhizobium ruizarguesonis]
LQSVDRAFHAAHGARTLSDFRKRFFFDPVDNYGASCFQSAKVNRWLFPENRGDLAHVLREPRHRNCIRAERVNPESKFLVCWFFGGHGPHLLLKSKLP